MGESYVNISNSTIINGKKIDLEKLSELEHEQWMNWVNTLLDRMYLATLDRKSLETFYIEMKTRWMKNLVPYDQLSDDVKEYDRIYANKVLEVIYNGTNL